MKVNIYKEIDRLIKYGIEKKLISVWDIDYVRNSLLDIFELSTYESVETENESLKNPVPILDKMLDYAIDEKLIENAITDRDIFDTKIMDKLVPFPGEVIRTFYEKYQSENAERATDYFYQLSKDSNYIRTNRIAKNVHWFSPTQYGDLEITINLSKPEKDPKAIAAAKGNTSASYPKCLLCKENVGYAGRLDHPARHNHRIIPLELEGERWYLQYSPYVYYNEHAIVFSRDHRPMKVSKAGFDRLLDFVEQYPHYFVGSNADLPIVGGSILSHDHFQAGYHDFPMAKAPVEETYNFNKHPGVTAGIVNWPMSVLRLQSENRRQLTELGEEILSAWREYTDESVGILSRSNEEPHNTITPIARMRGGTFELDLVFRNNRTDKKHPLGIFHPHEEVHHIKKENIGLIEVMGLAVLPGRLIDEMDELSQYILTNQLIVKGRANEKTAKHVDWALKIVEAEPKLNESNIKSVLRREIGKTFSSVLEHSGVFKRTSEGKEAFVRFIKSLDGY
ncbi:UDP-glucose--hexose-1-phosphate uridylyltransferase [Halobacillus massiliensis]|uniref:UDP-glucose--hexose-1-phosphate uridylyltransferase n=1 Tax=Halobacillus massiliensis TaxID=1926286 RepID=UPI0009E60F9D|nr:UDP-glucose--hexose-1-phosphate uridylyltransferase [Halobacillus massiliensis]